MNDAPYVLTDADRALIERARSAFASDFVYLEKLLWAARDRMPEQDQTSKWSKRKPTG